MLGGIFIKRQFEKIKQSNVRDIKQLNLITMQQTKQNIQTFCNVGSALVIWLICPISLCTSGLDWFPFKYALSMAIFCSLDRSLRFVLSRFLGVNAGTPLTTCISSEALQFASSIQDDGTQPMLTSEYIDSVRDFVLIGAVDFTSVDLMELEAWVVFIEQPRLVLSLILQLVRWPSNTVFSFSLNFSNAVTSALRRWFSADNVFSSWTIRKRHETNLQRF